jgi:hypothetical protein
MNGTLIYGLATLGSGVLGLSIRYCFKSKCNNVNLCFGLLSIDRNTDNEVKVEGIELEHGVVKQESMTNLNN